MTAPVDSAQVVIDAFIAAMKAAFNPDDAVQPPVGGGSKIVRFLASDVIPIEYWDAHAIGDGDACSSPFLWVRLMRRYRSRTFPTPTIDTAPCDLPRVIDVEIGVGRCASLGDTVDWDAIARESEISFDDSYRLELALCDATRRVNALDHLIATGLLVPYGPEGGVLAWSAVAHVQL